MKTKGMIVGILIPVGIFAGCATQEQSSSPSFGKAPSLNTNYSVYVAMPKNGGSGNEGAGSGIQTQDAIVLEAGKYFKRVIPEVESGSNEKAVSEAKAKGCNYLMWPEILRWEDEATEWTGARDKLDLLMTIIDVPSGEMLHRMKLSGKSSWATLGGDHPQAMLPGMMTNYFGAIFSGK
jgi:hypothetical protein